MKNTICIFGILLFYFHTSPIWGQCLIQPVQGAHYGNGSCRGLSFQYVVGTMQQAYGECGGLHFTPALTNDDFTNRTQTHEWGRITMYPNPALDVLYLEGPRTSGMIYVEVLHPTGYTLLQHKGDILPQQLNISHLVPGMYYVRVKLSDNTLLVHKLLKI